MSKSPTTEDICNYIVHRNGIFRMKRRKNESISQIKQELEKLLFDGYIGIGK